MSKQKTLEDESSGVWNGRVGNDLVDHHQKPLSERAHPNVPMSPAQAAHRVGVSRRTVMRAIECHALQAFRDNRNHWKINPDDLSRWALPTAPSEHAHQDVPSLPSSYTLQLAVVKAENAPLRERLEEARTERDRWQAMAAKLADRPRRRWWPWGGS